MENINYKRICRNCRGHASWWRRYFIGACRHCGQKNIKGSEDFWIFIIEIEIDGDD